MHLINGDPGETHIDEYLSWLPQGYSAETISGIVVVTAPDGRHALIPPSTTEQDDTAKAVAFLAASTDPVAQRKSSGLNGSA